MSPITIPPNQPVQLRVELPAGIDDWPGPPSWTPSDPLHASIQLLQGEDGTMSHREAQLICSEGTPDVSVRVECLNLEGESEFHVQADAPMAEEPIVIKLAQRD